MEDKTEEPSNDSSEKRIAVLKPLSGELDTPSNTPSFYSGKKDAEKRIFVQVDDKTIDEALKRKGIEIGEAFIVDDDDKSIIDKMLKKRGKDKDKI